MRLGMFASRPAGPGHLGLWLEDGVLDLTALGRKRDCAGLDLTSLEKLLAGHPEALPRLAGITADLLESSTREELASEGLLLPFSEINTLAPLSNPNKIVCVGLNYRDHCAEHGAEPPPHPILFAKFSTALTGPGCPIVKPAATHQLDYETELAVVIARRGKNIPRAEAMNYVAGYTIFNDVSARDIQFGDRQWLRGKTYDTFAPIGPHLVTADEVPDPQNLRLRCWVNGELRQDGNTASMIFDVPSLIAFISEVVTLLPGDLIATGTPAGVGVFRQPPVFLQPGDRIRMEIEKLGVLENYVTA